MCCQGKKELVSTIAKKTGSTEKQTTEFIYAFTETITEILATGEKVQLVGFGTFLTRKREARQGSNPATGKAITIPSSVVPAFKPGKGLKDRVNGK